MNYNGIKLRDEIARREQSIPEFARNARLSNFAVYRALSGGRANTRTLGKIANALNLDKPSDLLQSTSPPR